MITNTHSTEGRSPRVAFEPLKPKRRCKAEEDSGSHEPVLINAQLEFRHHRERIRRSGRPTVRWQRITPPTELSEILPNRSRRPVLARVVDKVKAPHFRNSNPQGIWALLRCWALALR